MGKHNKMGGGINGLPDNVLPADFDSETVSEFFRASAGLREEVVAVRDAVAASGGNGLGARLSEIAKAKFSEENGGDDPAPEESNGETVEFNGALSTDEEEILAHMHDHHHADDGHDHADHGDDHICDENCGEDCAHVQNQEEEIQVAEDARSSKGGPSWKNDTDSDGSGGQGRGKKKKDTNTDSEEPVPAPEPDPQPEPEPEPEPVPDTNGDFGWIDSNTYLSGGDTPNGFNVELKFNNTWTATQKQAAADQAEILSDMITGDLFDYGDIDDVRIQMYNENIDGAGGVWGRGGWISLRSDGMVAEGGVRVDSNDIGTAESWGMLDELFMHEMLHAIGFGTTWSRDGLISNGAFVGETAMDVYGSAVPLNGNGHLDESVGNQMGTTHITNNAEDITDLTLAILEDMGFETVYGSDTTFV